MSKKIDPDSPLLDIPDDEKEALTPAGIYEKKDHEAGTAKSTHFTTNGLAITEDGRLKKSKYLNVIAGTIDDYSHLILTKEEATRVRNTVFHLKHGSTAAIPVICTGPHCPWASRCPLQQVGKAPVGLQCLIELNLLKQWQLNYLEEYQVEPDNFTEMTLINELVEVELLLYRCNLSMSLDPEQATGVVDVNIGFDNNGNPITQKQISQMHELREKLLTRKHRLVKYLVGDRQEKYKREAALKVREARDPSSSMAALKEQMDALQRELGKASETLLIPGKVVENAEEKSGGSGTTRERGAVPLTPDDLPAEEDEE